MLPDDERRERWNRQLPQSNDSERGLLASFMHSPHLLDAYGDLAVDVFCHPSHRKLFEVMREMNAQNVGLDLITLTQRLEDKGVLDGMGGAGWVTEIFTFVPTSAMHRNYADIVREKWVRRKMLAMAEVIGGAAVSEGDGADIEALVATCEEAALKLRGETDSKKQDAVQHCAPAVMGALDHLEAAFNKRGGIMGISTGITDLDRMTDGLMGPRLYVFGGLPGSGKTSLALQIAEFVAIEQAKETLIFTQEMGGVELMVRTICRRAEIDLQRTRDGFMGRNDIPNISRKACEVTESRLFLDETPGLTTAQFRARCRGHKMRHDTKLIVVDYLQLMHGVSKAARDNRQQEIAEISGTLKAVAKELNVPVIVLAQLKRDAEDRKGPPKLADLRESGAIGQDADFVGLLHALDSGKKSGKAKESAKADFEDDDGGDEGPQFNTILNVVKQRQGPVGEIKLNFTKKYTRFENVTGALYSNNEEQRQK